VASISLANVPHYAVSRAACKPPHGSPGPNLYCAVIVKRVDEKTRAKTSINELFRT
jgi:2,3,4,5-tetrahydropyridine-2,6-dicarboxylate N-succinyltransferase